MTDYKQRIADALLERKLAGKGTVAYCRKDGIYVVPIGCLKD
jgi:hypothetical protein